MAKYPLSTLLAFTCALGLPAALACGGWDEEPAPLLSTYLDRLPAKSFGTIFLETRAPTPAAKAVDLSELTSAFTHHSRADWLQLIDEQLIFARENYTDADDCNWLHDARDAVASKGHDEEVAAYLTWRHDHRFAFDVDPPLKYGENAPKRDVAPALKDIDEHLAKATPTLQPQWIYARAAVQYRSGDRVACQQDFDRVWQKFPEHPRAEAALFMSGRCLLSQSRTPSWDYSSYLTSEPLKAAAEAEEKKIQLTRDESEKRFTDYLTRYPKGRFVADAHGWLGALALARQDRLGAVRHYIQQLETPGHPEVIKSAFFMCEHILSDLQTDEDAVLAEVAQHPVVAMGTTYLVLNQSGPMTDAEAQQWNGLTSESARNQADTARAKHWRQIVLPKLAMQVVAQKSHYTFAAWTPRYLAILAQAASAAGNQPQAIELTQIPSASLEGSDDLLLARAIALQRNGQVSEALETFGTLLRQFPKSPLAPGARLKYAVALQDNHQAGEAVAMLKQLLPDPTTSPAYYGAEVNEITQIISAQENFAPLPELASVLSHTDLDPVVKSELRDIVGQRYLAQEDFAAAASYLSPAQLALDTGPLPALMTKLATAKTPRAKANAENAIGDAWAALRGHMLQLPKITSTQQDLLRTRDNGKSLGFKNTSEALEERDELRHASRWWMRAAREQAGTKLSTAARQKALDAMPLLASASDFGYLRAVETNAAETSHQLYDRLRKEAPSSPEAKTFAVYWSFPVRAAQRADFPFITLDQSNARQLVAIQAMGWTALDYGAFGITRNYDYDEANGYDARGWADVETRLQALETDVITATPDQLSAKVKALRQDVNSLYNAPEEARYLNLLDDLTSFLQTPKLTTKSAGDYVTLRLLFNHFLPVPLSGYDSLNDQQTADREHRIDELLNSADLKPYADFTDFIAAYRRGSAQKLTISDGTEKDGTPVTYERQDYRALAQEMQDYRHTHPHSPKREAALYVQIRAAHWLTTPIYSVRSQPLPKPKPQSGDGEDNQSVSHNLQPVPFDPAPLRKLLTTYEHEFPAGRYEADLANFRGDLAWRTHDWPAALDLTLKTLADPQHPDLQPEAAERLANIFADLAKAPDRAPLLKAIKARPAAITRLQQYLAKTWDKADHPLRYLGQYLADQAGFAYTEPAPSSDN